MKKIVCLIAVVILCIVSATSLSEELHTIYNIDFGISQQEAMERLQEEGFDCFVSQYTDGDYIEVEDFVYIGKYPFNMSVELKEGQVNSVNLLVSMAYNYGNADNKVAIIKDIYEYFESLFGMPKMIGIVGKGIDDVYATIELALSDFRKVTENRSLNVKWGNICLSVFSPLDYSFFNMAIVFSSEVETFKEINLT